VFLEIALTIPLILGGEDRPLTTTMDAPTSFIFISHSGSRLCFSKSRGPWAQEPYCA
jgi:hypothetical protein